MIGEYFHKRKGSAMALATVGSGLGTLAFAPLFTFFFASYGFFGACALIGAIMLNNVAAGAVLRPVGEYLKPIVVEVTVELKECTAVKDQGDTGDAKIDPDDAMTCTKSTNAFPGANHGRHTEKETADVTAQTLLPKQGCCERLKSALLTRCQIFNNLTFLLYCLNVVCMPLCIQTIYLIIPRYVEEQGISKTRAAGVVALMGLTSTIGR